MTLRYPELREPARPRRPDSFLTSAAILFASFKLRPRPWHFGPRPTQPRSTIGWAVLGFALMLGIALAYIALIGAFVVAGCLLLPKRLPAARSPVLA